MWKLPWLWDWWGIFADYYGPLLVLLVKWWSSQAETITKNAAAIAVIVGGFSAYVRFFYGQTFFYRIDPNIKVELINVGEVRFLKIKVEAKNIGTVSCHFARAMEPLPEQEESPRFSTLAIKGFSQMSKVPSKWRLRYRQWARCEKTDYTNGSWLVILRAKRSINSLIAADLTWDGFATPWGVLQLFQDQEWIRAGETISDEYLVELPPDDTIAVRVEARLISKPRILRPCGDEWHAYAVLTLNTDQKEGD